MSNYALISIRIPAVCLVLLLYSLPAQSQNKIQKICGEYLYGPPSNVSIDEAIKTAIERAKLTALAEEFNTVLDQSNNTNLKNESGRSKIDFSFLSGSQIRGEWIGDIDPPITKVYYENNMLFVKAEVCGKARKITKASIDFSAKLLRNGTDLKFESESFMSDDDLFLYFKSPTNGFLAVYLIDYENNAFCLLPYPSSTSGTMEVEHGKEYIFFSKEKVSPNEASFVVEYQMTAEKPIEINQITVIFSPNAFRKANDDRTTNGIPRNLSFTDFQQWLQNCRMKDEEMSVVTKQIEIKRE